MKPLLLAAIVALLCMQTSKASPTGGVSENSESRTEYYHSSSGGDNVDYSQYFGNEDAGTDGEVSYTSETKDGKTTVTRKRTSSGGTVTYTSSSTSGGSSHTSGSKFSGGSTADGSTSTGGSTITDESNTTGDSNTTGGTTTTTKTTITKTTIGSEHDADCEDVGLAFDEKDLNEFFSDAEISKTATHYHEVRDDCYKQLAERNSDNDNLITQLKSSGVSITTLTQEKSWALGELEQCRDMYSVKSKEFEKITTEIMYYQKKVKKAVDEYGKIKTELVAANSEAQKWKTRSESVEIELRKCKENNVHLSVTVNEYITKISSLQTTINEATIRSNKCGTESEEWKSKYESAHIKVTTAEKKIRDLEATVADLKTKNAKLSGDLDSCRKSNNDDDEEIRTLKTCIDDYKNQESTLKLKLGECNVALDHVTNTYNEDEKQDVQDAILRQKLELQLEQTQVKYSKLEISYKNEQTLVEKCKKDITVIRDDHAKTCKKYDDEIAQLKITFKISLEKCEASVKSEKDINASIRIEIKHLSVRITEIEQKLAISVKISEDWQKKTRYCEDETITLKKTIETFKINLADTSTQLTTCVQHSTSLQTELTTVQTELDTCSTSLTEYQKKSIDNEAIIVKLKGEIGTCEARRQRSETELATLRCDVNQFLTVIESAEDRAYKAILEVKGLFDGNKAASTKFVKSHNIECKTCGEGGPCIEGSVNPIWI